MLELFTHTKVRTEYRTHHKSLLRISVFALIRMPCSTQASVSLSNLLSIRMLFSKLLKVESKNLVAIIFSTEFALWVIIGSPICVIGIKLGSRCFLWSCICFFRRILDSFFPRGCSKYQNEQQQGTAEVMIRKPHACRRYISCSRRQ
jgi:hypothetical protein